MSPPRGARGIAPPEIDRGGTRSSRASTNRAALLALGQGTLAASGWRRPSGRFSGERRGTSYCFGPGTKGYDPELVVTWTRGAVQVTRCWNDCADKKEPLFTARR
jgi:hypothetical protein